MFVGCFLNGSGNVQFWILANFRRVIFSYQWLMYVYFERFWNSFFVHSERFDCSLKPRDSQNCNLRLDYVLYLQKGKTLFMKHLQLWITKNIYGLWMKMIWRFEIIITIIWRTYNFKISSKLEVLLKYMKNGPILMKIIIFKYFEVLDSNLTSICT